VPEPGQHAADSTVVSDVGTVWIAVFVGVDVMPAVVALCLLDLYGKQRLLGPAGSARATSIRLANPVP
jgi:hypothetical protein